MRTAGALVTLSLALVACERDKTPSEPLFDVSSASAQISAKLTTMWDRPAVSKAMSGFLEAIVADKNVRAQSSALTDELGADPHVTGAIQSLMSDVGNDPDIQAAVLAVMQAHPGATADQAGELYSAHIEEVWSRPPASDAVNEAFGRFFPQIEHDPAIAAAESSLSARIEKRYSDAEVIRRWNKRIQELAGSAAPTRQQATDLLLSHMLDDQRLDQLGVELLANPTLRTETSAALGKLLAMKAVRADLHKASATLLADATVRGAVLDLFRQLSSDHPQFAGVRRALDTILTAPALTDALQDLIRIATTDPDARAVFTTWLDHVGADPALGSMFDKLLYGW
jgi:hypothetical protein